MNSEDFNQLIGAFIAETLDFLQSMADSLLALEGNISTEERLQAVKDLFRSAHSIKGSALMFGFAGLSTAAHALEDCFAILRDRVDLATIDKNTVTALLQGLDCLETIAHKVFHKVGEIDAEIEAIAQIKVKLEKQYGKPTPPTITTAINSTVNQPIIKIIFEQDLPPVLNNLETEISQATAENLTNTITALNQIYYQLSGLAGMLQLPEFGQIADGLRVLIDTPQLNLEQLQLQGWEIAQNLQTSRTQLLQGQPISIAPARFSVVDSLANSESKPDDNSLLVKTQDEQLLSNLISVDTPSNSPPTAWQRPSIRVDLERLTELVNLVGELVINRTNLEVQESHLRSEAKRIRRSIFDLNQFGSQLREEYDLLSTVNSKQGSREINPQADSQNSFDLLEMDQYSEFHSTAQSVIETTDAIAQSATKIDDLAVNFERTIEQLRRITDQLRTRVMQVRIIPFSRVVDHLPRALREMCRTYNKEVNLLLLGRDTKIDESLIDALRDPLVHLVRNAFDHGIEPSEIRQALGKPATGQIVIEARHQGGQTIITISDDGRGIDSEVIRRRVVDAGFVTAETANDLSIAELYDYLFAPSFSTAGEVTNLSGRGVGLDVVRTNLRQVRGSVKVDSRVGKGTSFILKLPLMLSITDALLVKVDRNTIAVPLDAIEELLQVQIHQIHMAGTQPMLLWREEFIRLVRLQELLHYSIPHPDGPSPDPLSQDYIPIMVLSSNEGVLAVAVDRLVGQQEIVIKTLPPPLSKPLGIVGSTILGDGRVVTILDVDDLISKFNTQTSTSIPVIDKRSPTLAPTSISQPQILIVDDSYTIRQLLSLTLSKARYRVTQAKDGQDALAQLERGLDCSLIISDIEMPKMDGFELLKNLKSHPNLATIPVAMLTSRSGFKHRQMASELGAVHYFTKPYSEQQLLEAIAQLLHKD